MRKIGALPDQGAADTFVDALRGRGIAAEANPQKEGGLAIWVHDERLVETAKEALAAFEQDPQAFRADAEEGRGERERAKKEEARRERAAASARPQTRAPVTATLVAAAIVVAVVSRVGTASGNVGFLFISQAQGFLPEVLHGQVWRLWTPILLHFGVLHLVFNLWWLWGLGRALELRRGTPFLLLLVLASALPSNLAEYAWSGPSFGGMSGVVYALFGYAWIKGRVDPWSGIALSETTVMIMLGWLVLCMTGLLGPIANAAHVVGLLAGCAWAFVEGRR